MKVSYSLGVHECNNDHASMIISLFYSDVTPPYSSFLRGQNQRGIVFVLDYNRDKEKGGAVLKKREREVQRQE